MLWPPPAEPAPVELVARPGALPGTRLSLVGDRLEVTGTDQDITISTEVTVAGLSDGVVVAPGRLLTDIVRALEPGAVLLQGDEEELQLSAGRSQFVLRPYRPGDFPHLVAPNGASVSLSTAGLVEALRQVVRAASSEDTRPVLTGVLMAAESEGIRLVATDSYRLAVKDLPGARGVLAEGQKVLVPSRALSELQRLLGGDADAVEVQLGAHDVRFAVGQVKLTTRLIEGEFPPYRQLIPFNYPNRLVIGREAFLDAIRRVRLVARRHDARPHLPSLRHGSAERDNQRLGPGRRGSGRQVRGRRNDDSFQPSVPG